MRSAAVQIAAALGVVASAFGGVVVFDPPEVVVPVGTGEMVFTVWVDPDTPSVDAMTMVIGSEVVPLTGFKPFFTCDFAGCNFEGPFITPNGLGIYPYEVYYGFSVSPLPFIF